MIWIVVVVFVNNWMYHNSLLVNRQSGIGWNCHPTFCECISNGVVKRRVTCKEDAEPRRGALLNQARNYGELKH